MVESTSTTQAKAPAVTPEMPDTEELSAEEAIAEGDEGQDVVEVTGGKLKDVILMSDPRWLNTPWNEVAVFGHTQISEKMLNILGACLNLPDFDPNVSGENALPFGVCSIVIVDHPIYDKAGDQAYALYYDQGRVVMISLPRIFQEEVEVVFLGEDNRLSPVAMMQMAMIEHFLHEVYHSVEYMHGVDINNQGAEDRATEFAHNRIIDVVKLVDCEPVIGEEPYFGRMLAELVGDLEPGEGEVQDPHVQRCIDMITNGVMLLDDRKEPVITITSFKDAVKITRKADVSDPAWNSASPMINFIAGKVEPVQPAAEAQFVTGPDGVTEAMSQAGLVQKPVEEVPFELDDEGEIDPPDPEIVDEGEVAAAGFSAPVNGNATQEAAGIDITSMFPKPATPAAAPPNAPEETAAFSSGGQGVTAAAPAPTAPASGGFGVQVQPGAPQQQQPAPTQAPAASLPQNGLSEPEAQRLFIILANNIDRIFFNHCGWNGQGGFTNPKAVTQQPLHLEQLDPKMPEFVIAADCEINGQYTRNRPTDGGQLYGNYKAHAMLPGYTVYLNMNGMLLRRALIPQNPNTGSTWASWAQQGHQMTNILDDDPNLKQARITDKMKAQVINGTYTPFQKG